MSLSTNSNFLKTKITSKNGTPLDQLTDPSKGPIIGRDEVMIQSIGPQESQHLATMIHREK